MEKHRHAGGKAGRLGCSCDSTPAFEELADRLFNKHFDAIRDMREETDEVKITMRAFRIGVAAAALEFSG